VEEVFMNTFNLFGGMCYQLLSIKVTIQFYLLLCVLGIYC